ncbi:hydroxymethylbilane synthase [Methanopyrus sp.]
MKGDTVIAPETIRVATRSSRLAIIQTREVIELLERESPYDIEVEIVKTRSRGDIVRDRPLHEMGEKGVFVKEVDRLVLEGKADIAVHSAKDVPSTVDYPVDVAAVPPRKDPRECLVSRRGRLKELPRGAIVGTSSPRRRAQILLERPDLKVKSMRGNVDTRVSKVRRGEYDAAVLAKVGLDRLGMTSAVSEVYDPEEFVPPAGQGALIVTCREDDDRVKRLLEVVDDERSRVEVETEKAVVRELGVGCSEPVGVHARARYGGHVKLVLGVFEEGGARGHVLKMRGSPEDVVREAVSQAREVLPDG